MILPGQMIRERCVTQELLTPFSERSVANGMSYGLSIAGYDVRLDQEIDILPGQFKLASTIELFRMPLDLIAFVHDKSTLARRGLSLFNTVIEPGWEGYLTLELTNQGPDPIYLPYGSPIAQIIFKQLAAPAEKAYVGKYQGQKRGPQPAIFEQ